MKIFATIAIGAIAACSFLVLFNRSSQAVTLYYYSPADDTENGNVLCSSKGLVAVKHTIPVSNTPIADAIELLLRGELTSEERRLGITTEFPLDGLEILAANNQNGILTLEFNDPMHTTSGGSCRVFILRAQIEATAKQFEGVTEVRFTPEELFQP